MNIIRVARDRLKSTKKCSNVIRVARETKGYKYRTNLIKVARGDLTNNIGVERGD